MIGHDHPSMQAGSLAFEMSQRFGDDRGVFGITQQAFPIAMIEPTLETAGELPME